jgi:hypothetical protein
MYSRIQNDNGTFNTRCLDCFMTIASSVETERDLYRLEEQHICPERALSNMLKEVQRTDESISNQRHPRSMHG